MKMNFIGQDFIPVPSYGGFPYPIDCPPFDKQPLCQYDLPQHPTPIFVPQELPPWGCHSFQPPPPPPPTISLTPIRMQTVPFVSSPSIQRSVPSTSSASFYSPVMDNAMSFTEAPNVIHKKYQRENVKEDWESVFKRAASRYGIKVEDSPLKDKGETSKANECSNPKGTDNNVNTKQEESKITCKTSSSSSTNSNQSCLQTSEPNNIATYCFPAKQKVAATSTREETHSFEVETDKKSLPCMQLPPQTTPTIVTDVSNTKNDDGKLGSNTGEPQLLKESDHCSCPNENELKPEDDASSNIYLSEDEFESDASGNSQGTGDGASTNNNNNNMSVSSDANEDSKSNALLLSKITFECELDKLINDTINTVVNVLMQEINQDKENTSKDNDTVELQEHAALDPKSPCSTGCQIKRDDEKPELQRNDAAPDDVLNKKEKTGSFSMVDLDSIKPWSPYGKRDDEKAGNSELKSNDAVADDLLNKKEKTGSFSMVDLDSIKPWSPSDKPSDKRDDEKAGNSELKSNDAVADDLLNKKEKTGSFSMVDLDSIKPWSPSDKLQSTNASSSEDSVKDSIIKESSFSSPSYSDTDSDDDFFIKRALQKGIKVGDRLPDNGKSPLLEQKSKPKDCIDDMFERFAAKNGIRIGSLTQQSATPDIANTAHDYDVIATTSTLHCDTIVHHKVVDSYCRQLQGEVRHGGVSPFKSNTSQPMPLLSYNTPLQVEIRHDIVSPINSNTTKPRALNFEELARRNGIIVGLTTTDVHCQTDKSCTISRQSQTVNVVKVQSTSVQVDVDSDAFKVEFNEWMQDELNLVDPPAASFRELYCNEMSARTEAEKRLAVEMDENVKSQRNMKMLIDEMKQQLLDKDNTIEKLTKDLKSTKKQKDNEIKRLTKDIKQKEEDISELKHANQLQEIAIDGINDISKDQAVRIQELESKLKEVEDAMEKEIKKNRAYTLEPKNVVRPQEPEWQIVKGRSSKNKKGVRLPHLLDSLSCFDEDNFNSNNGSSCSAESVHNGSESGESHQGTAARTLSQGSDDYKSFKPLNKTGEDNNGTAAPGFPNYNTAGVLSSVDTGNRFCQLDEPMLPAFSNPSVALPSSSTAAISISGNVLPTGPPPGTAPLQSFTTCITTGNMPFESSLHFLINSIPSQLHPIVTNANQYTMGPVPTSMPPTKKITTKTVSKSANKFSSFDTLMGALRDRFPDFSRPQLMVYLKKAKDLCGTNGFKSKEISEIVSKVAEVIESETF